MHFVALISTFTFGLLTASAARAQVDPSSALLLGGGGGGGGASESISVNSQRDGALQTGRYTVRPKAEGSRREESRPVASKKAPAPSAPAEDDTSPVTITLPPGTSPEAPARDSTNAPTVVSPTSSARAASTSAPAKSGGEDKVAPIANSVRDSGRRLNLVELSVAPGYLYNDSSSNYFYRRYSTSSPSIGVQADVWFSSELALHGSYLGTLSGSVNDSFSGIRNASASQQWFNIGIRSRKFFGPDIESPVIIFGLDYFEYQFYVPADTALRERLRSAGAQLSVEVEVPNGGGRSWVVGATLSPKLQHKESATAVNFQSGGSVDANAVGINVGMRLQLERRNAVFFKLSHSVEKNLFSGDATLPDPILGMTPSGVTVTNSFTLIQFGYTWGD